MGYLNIAKKLIDELEKKLQSIQIEELTLKEFALANLTIPVYSNILEEEILFCSNEQVESKLSNDNSKLVKYTANELIELMNLNPNSDDLKKTHLAKKMFDGKIVETNK